MKLEKLVQRAPWEWPDSAAETLLSVLCDERATEEERLTAAELAGDVVVLNDALANALLTIICDSNASDELRCTAALALGGVLEVVDTESFDEPEALVSELTFFAVLDSLQKLYRDTAVPEELRRRALEASVRFPSDWHRGAVAAAYESNDPDWRVTALFAMRWVAGFDREIIDSLDSDDDDIVYHAIGAAGAWEIEEAWHDVEMLLDEDTSVPLLLAAMDAAASIRPAFAVRLLSEFTGSDNEEVAAAAADGLAKAEHYLREFDDSEDEEDLYDGYDDEDFDDDSYSIESA